MALNEEYFINLNNQLDKISDQIDLAEDCSALSSINDKLTEIMSKIEKLLTAKIEAELKQIEILGKLITIPSSPEDCITWITSFIDNLKAPYTASIQQKILLMQKYTEMLTKITGMVSRLEDKHIGLSCELTAPTIPNPLN